MNAERLPFFVPHAVSLLLMALCLGPVRSGAALVVERPPAREGETNAAPEAPGPTNGLVLFLNGNTLSGAFLGYSARTGLRWRHPGIKQIIDIDPATVASVRLPSRRVDQPGDTGAQVRLSNQDQLTGKLIELDGDHLTMETTYAGRLRIPRAMLAQVHPAAGGRSAIYEGPTGLEGWTARGMEGIFRARRAGTPDGPTGGWRYRNGMFYTVGSGTLGRNVELPGSANIEFDLGWRNLLNLGICLYTDNLDTYSGNCYFLQLSHSSIFMQRMNRNSGSTALGQAELPDLIQKSKLHFSIRVNKQQKSLALLVDGQFVRQWKDPGDFAGLGSGLLFYQQGPGSVSLSNIRITEWDGKLNDPVTSKPTDDLVRLINQDALSGALKEIRAGKMTLTTAFANLEIPMERIDVINLAADQLRKPAADPSQARLLLAGGGSITLVLREWTAEKITGLSPIMGEVQLRPEKFSLLQFNLDQQKQSDPELFDSGYPRGDED